MIPDEPVTRPADEPHQRKHPNSGYPRQPPCTGELSRQIETAYGRGFLRYPQANVLLLDARPRTVAVEGLVKSAGVYEIQPGSTLLSALALAGSPTDEAKLDEILVFRTVNGQSTVPPPR